MSEERESFHEFLAAKMKQRGFSARKLSEASGVGMKHVENLCAGNFDELPAAPYLRGYLSSIGRALDFDPEPWLEQFKKEGVLKVSGGEDALPENRFARKRRGRFIWLGLVVLGLIAFFAARFSDILGEPAIAIRSPSQNLTTTDARAVTIEGTFENGNRLTVNGETVPVENDGSWKKLVSLEPGLNVVEIDGKKFLGRTKKLIRQFVYEPAAATSTPAGPKTAPSPEAN